MGVKHVERDEHYEVTLTLTPEQYEKISNNASWESRTLEAWFILAASNYRGSGC